MIAKAKSISHCRESIDYAMKKEKAEIIDKHLITGENGKEISREFKIFQDLNGRCKNSTLGFVLSPEPSDGLRLSNSDFRSIARDFLKRLELNNHQSIIVKHSEKKHTHLHIYVNRMDFNGNAYKDSFISKKSQSVADEIAKRKKLIRAKEVENTRKAKTKELRAEIHSIHKVALQGSPKDFRQYSNIMETHGVKIYPSLRNGKIQGFRVRFKDIEFKASEVHRNMSFNKVELAIKSGATKKTRMGYGY